MTQTEKKAVFLDRDGTINIDYNFVHTIDEFKFIKGVIPALRELKKMGYLLIIVTNQSGIGRGIFSEEQFLELTQWMNWSLTEQGVELDGVYYCPHHLEAYGKYQQDCDCRKPKAGMLFEAQKDLNINLSQSIMVGDKASDLKAGINAGVPMNILVRTGKTIDDKTAQIATVILDSLADLPNFLKSH